MAVDIVRTFPDIRWASDGPTRGVEALVEDGLVLAFPHLPFVLDESERRFLDPRWADGKAKNISVRWPGGELRGTAAEASDADALRAMIVRYAEQAEALALRLFPHYAGHLRRGNSSFRPSEVSTRQSSWRKDDSRLHIDAFPSNPMQGTRLLRVFSNVNPAAEPRQWRVGERFEEHARRYLPKIGRPLPGSSALMHLTGITKRRRTEYDHLMLQLHDGMKSDLDYQKSAAQETVPFPAGSVWVCFSDQTSHAVMSGQYMLEQTLHLPAARQYNPDSSPLAILSRLTGRKLV